jgi:hypothetical protein
METEGIGYAAKLLMMTIARCSKCYLCMDATVLHDISCIDVPALLRTVGHTVT